MSTIYTYLYSYFKNDSINSMVNAIHIYLFAIINVLETTRVTQFTILHNYLYCYFKNYLYCFSKFDTVLTNINTILKIQLHLYNYFHFHNVLESWIRALQGPFTQFNRHFFKKDSLSTNKIYLNGKYKMIYTKCLLFILFIQLF
jgi:hypothetical protein